MEKNALLNCQARLTAGLPPQNLTRHSPPFPGDVDILSGLLLFAGFQKHEKKAPKGLKQHDENSIDNLIIVRKLIVSDALNQRPNLEPKGLQADEHEYVEQDSEDIPRIYLCQMLRSIRASRCQRKPQ